jgi:hypothetical protein
MTETTFTATIGPGRDRKHYALAVLATVLISAVVAVLATDPGQAICIFKVNHASHETACADSGEITIDVFLDSTPSTTYTLRFYSNPRNTGEGKTFIGDQQVTTNTNGTASINDFVAEKAVPVGQSITATATDPGGNTSEFSREPRSVRSAP